jgi:SAM-dependent methyltransferase
MHKQTQNLQTFYDNQAEKFSGTRKRHWPEFDHIVSYIKKSFPGSTPVRILELGCGDGRLLSILQDNLDIWISYTGVDISYNLLDIANKNHPDARWIHKDMVSFFKEIWKEEYDVVIAVASFHHLPTQDQRAYVLDGIYECLSYDGIFTMTNRCYSNWFNDKYRLEIRSASWKSIATLWYYNKNDIMVPWKDSQWILISKRLYHIFSISELNRLLQASGFTGIEHFYVDNGWKETQQVKDGRNLVSGMRKTIYKD